MEKIELTKREYKFLSSIYKSIENSVFINCIMIEGEYLIVTDGKRIHRMKYKKQLVDGWYYVRDTIKINSQIIHLILDKESRELLKTDKFFDDLPKLTFVCIDNTDIGVTSSILKIYEKTKRAITYAYIKPLKGFTWDVCGIAEAENKPLTFKNNYFSAVIMPFRYIE